MSAGTPLSLAVITISDTRTEETDRSGSLLCKLLQAEGHKLHGKIIVPDDVYQIRSAVSERLRDAAVHGVITTGGTGFTARDNTQRAIKPLFEVDIEGFGELFRQLSYQEIGSSTIQSRAFAGMANGTIVFCLPGSPGACQTGWDKIIREQLDSNHKPCNFTDKLAL